MKQGLQKVVKQYRKETILFLLVYLFWAYIQLKLKLVVTPTYFDGTLERIHHLLINFQYTNNEQSRILQWFIPQIFLSLFPLTIFQAYVLQRLIFTLLTLICFHFYLRKWFSVLESFAGVSAFAAIMPLTYMNDLQESSCLLLLTFLLGLWAIRSNRTFLLLAILVIGALNNETIVMLVLAYFFYQYRSLKLRDLWELLLKTFVVTLPVLLVLLPIRYITRNNPHLGGDYYILPKNFEKLHYQLSNTNIFNLYAQNYLYLFLIFGILWVFVFLNFRGKPVFLKRVGWIVPFFIFFHFLTGIISEVRQMLPLSFIVFPSFLFYLKTLLPESHDTPQETDRQGDDPLVPAPDDKERIAN